MSGEIREDETIGSLSKRVLTLESCNKWESWFGKSPGTVLSIFAGTLISAFWFYHTWQIERIDKNHQSEISNLQVANKDRIDWVKNQQRISVPS